MQNRNNQSQLEQFKSAACDLECDEDKGRFETRLGKIAAAKPAKAAPAATPKKRKAK